jgi:CMP-2-keto-3-deoxyoctulosonic acid synthetase
MTAREESTRFPNKLVRPLAHKASLFSLYCERYIRLLKLVGSRFAGATMAVGNEDHQLLAICLSHGIKPVLRSSKSVARHAELQDAFDFVKDIDCENFFWINGCHPFLEDETILSALETWENFSAIKTLTSVVADRSQFWDYAGVPICHDKDDGKFDTKSATIVYRNCHCFHIWPKSLMLGKGVPWGYSGPNDPYLFEVWRGRELLDVDTETDFDIVKAVYAQVSK